jgi:Lrp/AsnC family leucine-responsive transcriptional regulator
MTFDKTDRQILHSLMADGRKPWSDLASELKLSPPAAADRVRRLEQNGVIQGYRAVIDPGHIGCHLTAFVAVTLERPQHRDRFLKKIRNLAEVQECHHVAGDDDYLLKVRCENTRHLDRIISMNMKSLPGIVRTRTTIVMDTIKETGELPICGADEET